MVKCLEISVNVLGMKIVYISASRMMSFVWIVVSHTAHLSFSFLSLKVTRGLAHYISFCSTQI